jgi:hypothetical protein
VFAGATSGVFPQAVRRMRVVAMRREVLRFIVGVGKGYYWGCRFLEI